MAANPPTFFPPHYFGSYFQTAGGEQPPGSLSASLLGSTSVAALATGFGLMSANLAGSATVTANLETANSGFMSANLSGGAVVEALLTDGTQPGPTPEPIPTPPPSVGYMPSWWVAAGGPGYPEVGVVFIAYGRSAGSAGATAGRGSQQVVAKAKARSTQSSQRTTSNVEIIHNAVGATLQVLAEMSGAAALMFQARGITRPATSQTASVVENIPQVLGRGGTGQAGQSTAGFGGLTFKAIGATHGVVISRASGVVKELWSDEEVLAAAGLLLEGDTWEDEDMEAIAAFLMAA